GCTGGSRCPGRAGPLRAMCPAALGLAGRAQAAEPRHRIVVSAVKPIDADRLADSMRAYLDEFSVDVVTAPAAVEAELRAQLDATSATGADVRAIASIRVGDVRPGTIAIVLVDRLSGKSLGAARARPPRDEDLYRAVALKVQALLRSAFYERQAQLQSEAPALGRLVAAQVAPPLPRRLFLDAGYAVVAFP